MRKHRGKLSMPQFRALVRIEVDRTAGITEIADHLGTSLSTTSRVISGLVRRSFLKRDISAGDRRRATLKLTIKGRSVLKTAREATQNELRRVFQELGSKEQSKVIDAMRILRRLFAENA